MRPSNIRRLIVKIGSSLLTADGARLDADYIMRICAQVAAARRRQCEIVIVSSGAVAAGVQRLGWGRRPAERADMQVAAAVGQMRLSDAFEEGLSRHGLFAGQVLLTAEDMAHRTLYLNARGALRRMLAHRTVPVANENDVIATDSVRFGDNDRLAAQIANLLEADLLLMLTDVDGLRADGGKGAAVREAAANDNSLMRHAAPTAGGVGSGGMAGKLRAAKIAARSGAHSLIADGRDGNALARALDGDREFGTFLAADMPRLSARKQWLASGLNVCGDMVLDAGAVRALVRGKKSLLPAGVRLVRGDFVRGDSVALKDENGGVVGYALANYGADAARRLCGARSGDIIKIIGYMHEEEMAHRDNMSILESP
ncbi:MAG: glutamate 5-kinase [Betaproteobacteria bacterium]|nr:glutamate 5-kinase [Betaproteobacteria bacterium]